MTTKTNSGFELTLAVDFVEDDLRFARKTFAVARSEDETPPPTSSLTTSTSTTNTSTRSSTLVRTAVATSY